MRVTGAPCIAGWLDSSGSTSQSSILYIDNKSWRAIGRPTGVMGATPDQLVQLGFTEPIALPGIKRFIGQQFADIDPSEVQKLFGLKIVNQNGFMAFECESLVRLYFDRCHWH
jgi:hypothetical protein